MQGRDSPPGDQHGVAEAVLGVIQEVLGQAQVTRKAHLLDRLFGDPAPDERFPVAIENGPAGLRVPGDDFFKLRLGRGVASRLVEKELGEGRLHVNQGEAHLPDDRGQAAGVGHRLARWIHRPLPPGPSSPCAASSPGPDFDFIFMGHCVSHGVARLFHFNKMMASEMSFPRLRGSGRSHSLFQQNTRMPPAPWIPDRVHFFGNRNTVKLHRTLRTFTH